MLGPILLLWALAPAPARAADDLSDFSNNLVTDIAPLLVLFSDAMMFITGTIMMCVRMGSCAAQIGKATQRLSYENHALDITSRLIWTQLGGQTIGDQTFDTFAYFENRPLQTCTTSKTRLFDPSFESYTLFAVLVTLLGYIMQFIGLRGMKA